MAIEVFGIAISVIWFFIFIASIQGVLQEKFEVTLYRSVKLTWNEAKCFCESKRSRLLALDTEEKYENTVPSLKLHTTTGTFYWIGLHKFNNTGCSGYYWHNSVALGTFSAWDVNPHEPDKCNVDKCIRISGKGLWRTTECSKKFETLCEDIHPKCTFDVINNTSVDLRRLPSDATTILLDGNLTICQYVCEQSTSNNYPCRGIIVNTVQIPNKCTILFINSVSFLDDKTNLLENYPDDLFVRHCVTLKVVELHETDIDIIPNNNKTPIASCGGYNYPDQTLSATHTLRTTTGLQTTELMDQQTTNTEELHVTSSKDQNLKSKLSTLISDTKIEKSSTSASLRSRISIMEARTSAKSMGFVASFILTCTLAALFISDIPIFIKHVRLFWC